MNENNQQHNDVLCNGTNVFLFLRLNQTLTFLLQIFFHSSHQRSLMWSTMPAKYFRVLWYLNNLPNCLKVNILLVSLRLFIKKFIIWRFEFIGQNNSVPGVRPLWRFTEACNRNWDPWEYYSCSTKSHSSIPFSYILFANLIKQL